MATSKLNYANIRSAQRKNKSMHEAKDLLPKNLYSNSSLYNNLSPPFPIDQLNKLSHDHNSKGKVAYSLFDESSALDKLNYAKSLFGRYKEEPVRHEEKISRGHHHRVKSSITEMYHKNPEILEEDESVPSAATFGRFETTSNRVGMGNYNTLHAHEGTGSIISKLEEDYGVARERSIKENSKQREAGLVKEGRLLGDFLRRDGGFRKEMASPEDLRPKKKELSPGHEQIGNSIDKKSDGKLFVERSPRNFSIEDNLSPTGDFLTKLDNYIDYFKKSERSHRWGSKGGHEYFVEERGKSHEEGVRDTEMKMMKKQVESLNTKVNEVMKANKKILKEFGNMIIREDEYRQRVGNLEEEFSTLKRRHKKYREKLKIANHLLDKERTENENNLFALKKLLSSGVNLALEHRVRKHTDGQREKDVHHRKHEDRHEKNDSKERRSTDKRQSIRKEDSLFNQKISVFSNDDSAYLRKKTERKDLDEDDDNEEDDKLNTIEQEEDDLYSTSPDKQDAQYRKENIWSPPRHKRGQETSKEHQIKLLQEQLTELMEEREHHHSKYGHYEKVGNQVWPRDIDSALLNIVKQSKSRNHQTKHSGGVNTENFVYTQNTRERQGSHHKMNSFYSRGESGFD